MTVLQASSGTGSAVHRTTGSPSLRQATGPRPIRRSVFGPSIVPDVSGYDADRWHEGSHPCALSDHKIADVSAPRQVEVRRADPGTWDDHINTISLGFGMPVELASRLFGAVAFGDKRVRIR